MPQHVNDYTPVYQTTKIDNRYKDISMILVDTPKKFKTVVELWKDSPRIVGFDTETTGLNHEKVDLVGCSIAFDRRYSFYIPFGHLIKDGSPNLDLEYFQLVNTLLNKSERVLYWNKTFDKRIRRAFGHTNIREDNETDLQIEVYNWDTNVGMPALKKSVYTILGWNLPSFTTKFGKDANLAMFRPKEVLEYAGYDAVTLLYLYDKIPSIYPRSKYILNLDEKSCNSIAKIEEMPMPMNKVELKKLHVQYKAELKELDNQITKLAKQKINPNSPKQVSSFLISQKIDTGAKTKTGNMSCGADALNGVKHKHPALELIVKYREVQKAIGTYIKPMVVDGPIRFGYKTCQVSTGRLAGGTDKKNDFFCHVNIQGIPKAPSLDYFAVFENLNAYLRIKEEGQFPEDFKKNVEGWYFFPVTYVGEDKVPYVGNLQIGVDIFDGYIVEGFNPENNIRRAFVCREGDYFVHYDFSAQEMRLPANFSKDPVMELMFLSGEDPHGKTAIMLFGEANYNRDARKIAKILNFNLLYGGQKYSIAEKLECSPEEAQIYIDKWWNLFAGLRRWRNSLIKKGKSEKYIKTAFGRIRRVGFWVNSMDYKTGLFGERTIINTRVQGTAGDIIRTCIVRADKLDLLYSEICRILTTVHDEINFSVRKGEICQTLPRIREAMWVQKDDWVIPMDLGLSIGFSWGEMWDFEFVDGKLIPDGKYITKGN